MVLFVEFRFFSVFSFCLRSVFLYTASKVIFTSPLAFYTLSVQYMHVQIGRNQIENVFPEIKKTFGFPLVCASSPS
jgi:hypothetical protein